MSNYPSNLNTDDQEQLVAYLDGELPADQCATVEDRLSTDGAYRGEMQRLARAWDALDELPRATAGDNFAKTTIEMVTVVAEEEVAEETVAGSHRPIQRLVLAVGLLVGAAVLGFVGARSIWPDPNRQLVADLPIIENLDAFSQFQDIAFLRSLGEGVGSKYHVLGADALESSRNDLKAVSAATHSERRQLIREFDSNRARVLSVNFARFLELDGTEQRRLRRLHQEIIGSDDADILIDTMNQYSAWLADRTAGDRAALRGLSSDDRVQQIVQQLNKDRSRGVLQLSQHNRDALREAMIASVVDMRKDILQRMDRMDPRTKRRWGKLNDREFALQWVRLSAVRSMRQRDADSLMLRMFERASKSMSEEAQQFWEHRPSDRARISLMRHWTRQAFQPPEVSEEQLEEFFASDILINDDREKLLALPQKQMRELLKRRYNQHKYGFRWDRGGDRRPRNGPATDGPSRRGRGGGPDRGPGPVRPPKRPPQSTSWPANRSRPRIVASCNARSTTFCRCSGRAVGVQALACLAGVVGHLAG